MKNGFVEDLISNMEAAEDALDEGRSWTDVLADFRDAGAQVLSHPYVGRLIPAGPETEENSGEDLDSEDTLSVSELMYELPACTQQGDVCQLFARANRGVVYMRRAAVVLIWGGLSQTNDPASVAKNLATRLVNMKSGEWTRITDGVLYWKNWKTRKSAGTAAPAAVSLGVALQAPCDAVSSDGQPQVSGGQENGSGADALSEPECGSGETLGPLSAGQTAPVPDHGPTAGESSVETAVTPDLVRAGTAGESSVETAVAPDPVRAGTSEDASLASAAA